MLHNDTAPHNAALLALLKASGALATAARAGAELWPAHAAAAVDTAAVGSVYCRKKPVGCNGAAVLDSGAPLPKAAARTAGGALTTAAKAGAALCPAHAAAAVDTAAVGSVYCRWKHLLFWKCASSCARDNPGGAGIWVFSCGNEGLKAVKARGNRGVDTARPMQSCGKPAGATGGAAGALRRGMASCACSAGCSHIFAIG